MQDLSPANLSVGEIYEGRVCSVKRFGVFVALDGVEGLLDSWWLQKNVETWPTLGETVSVRVEKISEDGKVSLTLAT